MIAKKHIRKEIFRRRKEAASNDLNRWNKSIQYRLTEHEFYKACNTIYTYVAYKREVDTINLICQALDEGKRVAVPRVEGDEMNFYYITSIEQLTKSDKGILEPVNCIPAEDEDALMIMPGVAFDKDLHRIGYGGGYYDKYLAQHPSMKKFALAYEFQILDEQLPTESTDINPELIITEKRAIL